MPAETANVARHLAAMAAQQPGAPALRVPLGTDAGGVIRYASLSFAELAAEADAWAWKLARAGVAPGDRVLVLVRPGLPLIAAVFALFKLGAPPVVIDPGMGRTQFLACIARTQPRVLLGLGRAQLASWIFRDAFRSVRRRVWVSGRPARRLARQPLPEYPLAPTESEDLAAVLFTSGSTGTPKGVCYEHGMFEAQVRIIRATYSIVPGEIDLPMLPIFALFNPALGLTTIVPKLDPSRPATVDPAHVVQAIRQNRVTNSFGSPVIWTKVARYCVAHGLTLPGVKRILLAGAPVPPALFALLRRVFPDAALHSPYGATEALPVTTISAEEVIGPPREPAPKDDHRETGGLRNSVDPLVLGQFPRVTSPAATAEQTREGRGTCVGRVVAEMQVRIIAITDDPVPSLAEARELPPGEIGEIIVCGPVVTTAYDLLPDATARAKIQIPALKIHAEPASRPLEPGGPRESEAEIPGPHRGGVWHRMGDAGYLDEQGRLWFCGRLAERVETPGGTFFPDCVEPVFNQHPRVFRTALIGFGPRRSQVAALAVELWPEDRVRDPADRRALARQLRELGAAHPHTDRIHAFYFVQRFPVDVRHNAKIHRLHLARDLAGQPGTEADEH